MSDAPPPIVGRHIDVAYILDEDRISLTVRGSDGGCAFWLTRRLCRALLNGLVDILSRTSSMVARAPTHSRTNVLLFEHAEALSRRVRDGDQGAHQGLETPRQSPSISVQLLQRIDLSAKGDEVSFSLMAGGSCRAVLPLTRDNAHQLAAILFDKAQSAGWALDDIPWLDRRSQVILPEGIMPN